MFAGEPDGDPTRDEVSEYSAYEAGGAPSFLSASWGFTGLAIVLRKRWLEQR